MANYAQQAGDLLDSQGRYLHALGASTGTLEKIPGCEGLTLDLDALWAAVDNLE